MTSRNGHGAGNGPKNPAPRQDSIEYAGCGTSLRGMKKLFREDTTDTMHASLGAARDAPPHGYPTVSRVWVGRDGKIAATAQMMVYGRRWRTIAEADKIIMERLSRATQPWSKKNAR